MHYRALRSTWRSTLTRSLGAEMVTSLAAILFVNNAMSGGRHLGRFRHKCHIPTFPDVNRPSESDRTHKHATELVSIEAESGPY